MGTPTPHQSDFSFAAQFKKEHAQEQLLSMWKNGVHFDNFDVSMSKSIAKSFVDSIQIERGLKTPRSAYTPEQRVYVSCFLLNNFDFLIPETILIYVLIYFSIWPKVVEGH